MDASLKVLLIATGETDKLQPLTEALPSPMVPMGNRPVMAYLVDMLGKQGVKDIVVSLYHLPGQIEAYFGPGRRWGIQFEYILQRAAWGSAGALKWAESSLEDSTVLVIPADTIIDLDLAAALAQHRQQKNVITAILSAPAPGDTPRPTGAYFIEPAAVRQIPARTPFDIQRDLIPALERQGVPVGQVVSPHYWNGLETLADYQSGLRTYLLSSQAEAPQQGLATFMQYASLDGNRIAPGIWVGQNNLIHPSARFAPAIKIGDHCRIGRDVELGPDVVIGSNIIIDDDATIRESIILDNTYVGKLVNIENRIVNANRVVDIASGQSVSVTDKFLLDRTYQTDIDSGLKRFTDLFVTVILVFVLLPLFGLLSLLVVLVSGRVFRRSARQKFQPGMGDQDRDAPVACFNLLQFELCKKDGRQTRLGRWLERWDLHRLPELINVLRGDLSLIGVKPLSIDEAAMLTEDWQFKRYECPPGFSGLWYIQTGKDSELLDILVADVYYASTRNWRGDMRLVGQTVLAWYRRVKA